jgi:hypothetical protein
MIEGTKELLDCYKTASQIGSPRKQEYANSRSTITVTVA